jgi:putative pyruvate formate lyase activating enzyme
MHQEDGEMNRIYRIGNETIVIDPTPEIIPQIKKMNPSFRIDSLKPKAYVPVYQEARRNGSLDERIGKAMSSLYRCDLCMRNCGANRFREKGLCGVSDKAFYHPAFIHIFEEPVINPAIICNFPECSMDCVYCIAHDKNRSRPTSFSVDDFWKEVGILLNQSIEVSTMEFGGGEPTIYLPWIFILLKHSPEKLGLPVVLNCNLYVSPHVFELCNGVIDVFLVDLRYGNDDCARRLSKMDNYIFSARSGIETLVKQRERIIVRVLVLPDHYECCHRPSIEWLSQFRKEVWVSVLDQYVPEHKASEYPEIFRRPSPWEIEKVKNLVKKHGLREVNEEGETFWESPT